MSEGYDVLLRDGGIAHVRRLHPDDRAALHELVERSSERSAYLRFFTGGRNTAHSYMDRVTSGAYRGHALVAGLRGRLVAVAEYIPMDDGKADLAILIDDAVHGHGLGTLLLEHVALDAAEHGVRTLVADVLAENRPMIRVLRDLGLDVAPRFEGGMMHLDITARPTARLREGIEARDHEATRASLARLLTPRSVAVIGASRDERAVGHKVLRNLLDGGFPGPIHPVNPNAAEVAGLVCHAEVPGGVDLAVVAVPARHVLEVARDCARAGVAGLVVLTSGFAETGERDAEGELLRICRSAGMRLVGPNCLGVVNTAARLNASFLPHHPVRGRVALMSQSGAVGAALLERLEVSSFVSVGNKADVSGNDLLEYWEDDPGTDVIALYLESFGNPRKFARIARRVGRSKPVLLVKSGRSGAGGRAVRSHTAAAATPDVAVDALTRAAGVIRLDSVNELIDTAKLLAGQPLPEGRRVAIVGNSGGPQAMAADACERHGLVVPELPPGLLDARAAAALGNPVDLTADATADEIGSAVRAVVSSPGIDVVLIVYTPPFGSGLEQTRQAIAGATKAAGKTVLACLIGHDGLIDGRIPAYAFPEQAVAALAGVVRYAEWRRALAESTEVPVQADAGTARQIIEAELAQRPEGCWLSPAATARLLSCYGVRLIESLEVNSPDSAAEAARRAGLPVVLKAVGPVHKSDVGGVRLDLRTEEQARQAYAEMSARIGAEMTGAIVQPMLPGGVEMIVGGVNYPAFGPLAMVGMGGVMADLLADRAFRVPPVTDATGMIEELRCSPLLHGYRGSPPVAADALADQVTRVGRLLDDLPQVAELDLNPVIVTADGAITVDARIRLAFCEPQPSPLLRRLR
ncbi:bifunctional acetate--CoA ligase family protein/GNAT family N-acetyltransferase [Nonomuraea gerenzanensis]|uniref:Protein acetyltransferase n=1 Tax=Nonomuraea gerenzanensis TaxID=93944 RepID=A0A1M4EEG3_9ACTN|nr:bifunctional GNAT family N-acetyltransferase/acetate--CoA ligase family protein [Nonomuraea gerenzanensis]UBU08976.1 GNAT family N-acetyltransferase [Nonomuraea gerenzanensis]SBO97357.1 Protein acetyltransferase [Nonomuraea gerenzanensis]